MDYDMIKLPGVDNSATINSRNAHSSHAATQLTGSNDLCGLFMHIFNNINLRLGFAVLILSIIMYSDFMTEALLVPMDAAMDGIPTTYGYFILHLFMAIAVVVLDLLMKEGL